MNMKWFLILCSDFHRNIEFYFPKNPRSKIIYDREINKIGKERTEKLISDYEDSFYSLKQIAKSIANEIGCKYFELEDNQFLGDVL